MASTQILAENEPQQDDFPALSLAEILSGDNLTEHLDQSLLSKIGSEVVRDFSIDEESRQDWLKIYQRSLDTAMQVSKRKVTPWPGAANIKSPLLTVACIQFQARAYPAIVDGSNLVKGRVLGPDPDGEKRERADRIGQHMTWQLLYRMKDWEESTDRLLLMLPITGCVFRKTYYDPIACANCSDIISADDFVVNYTAKSLDSAPRFTHRLRLYPYEARERIASGLWRKVTFSVGEDADEDGEVIFYEQHRMIDLDEDGIMEHYVVTTTIDGAVARIVPCFDENDVYVRGPDGKIVKAAALEKQHLIAQNDDGMEEVAPDFPIVRIERQQYFTKYGFIPAPDGSFYDIGFGALLYNLGEAIDTAMNQMLDAATLQNAGGGFIGAGFNIRGGNFAFKIGEWKRVEAGGPIKDNIFPLPAAGPSQALFNLLGMLVDWCKQITSVQDVLTGAAQGPNTPVGTTLAQIEQGQKVMTAIFKRVHRAFGQELRILRRLNRDFLDDEEYFQLNDEDKPEETGEDGQPVPQQPVKVGRDDYQDADLDVVPVSDPTIVTDVQRMAKAQALLPFRQDPLVNPQEVLRRYFDAIGEPDIKALLTLQKQPDPALIIEGMKQTIAKQDSDAKMITVKSNAAKMLTDAATGLELLGLTQDAAILAGMATQLGGEVEQPAGKPSGGPGPVPGMAGQGGDASVPGVAPAPAIGPDAGMGAGPPDDGGQSGVGGDPGSAGGPVA